MGLACRSWLSSGTSSWPYGSVQDKASGVDDGRWDGGGQAAERQCFVRSGVGSTTPSNKCVDRQVAEEGRQEGSCGVERRESNKLSRAIPNETMEGQRGRKKSQNDFIRRRNGSGTLVALTTFTVG